MITLNTTEETIAGLLHYSLRDTNYEFKNLTEKEKEIVNSQKDLNAIKHWIEWIDKR